MVIWARLLLGEAMGSLDLGMNLALWNREMSPRMKLWTKGSQNPNPQDDSLPLQDKQSVKDLRTP